MREECPPPRGGLPESLLHARETAGFTGFFRLSGEFTNAGAVFSREFLRESAENVQFPVEIAGIVNYNIGLCKKSFV